MRKMRFALALAVGLSGLFGCDSSSPTQKNTPTPPPQDSGADKEAKGRGAPK